MDIGGLQHFVTTCRSFAAVLFHLSRRDGRNREFHQISLGIGKAAPKFNIIRFSTFKQEKPQTSDESVTKILYILFLSKSRMFNRGLRVRSTAGIRMISN